MQLSVRYSLRASIAKILQSGYQLIRLALLRSISQTVAHLLIVQLWHGSSQLRVMTQQVIN